MKRLITLLTASLVTLLACVEAFAEHNFGVLGGVTLSTLNIKELNNKMVTRYHAGLTYRFDLPKGFAIQPSILYHVKGADFKAEAKELKFDVGYLEVPVSFQWGPDLLLFRPFLDVTPFVGVGLNNAVAYKDAVDGKGQANDWTDLSRWEYGVGVGLGLDIWRFQVIGRYNWNLGSIASARTDAPDLNEVLSKTNFSGVTVSLVFFF